MRANQFIAKALGVSRRDAEDLIAKGGFKLNGAPLVHPGRQIEPGRDELIYRGRALSLPQNCYLILHKPAGYVCSRTAQGEAPTVYELLPEQYRDLKYAGRLDKDSAGLMIFSNDGDFIQKLTHPAFEHEKEYLVKVWYPRGARKNAVLNRLNRPLKLEDGFTATAEVELYRERPGLWELIFVLREGHKRQIREMCREVGLKVVNLLRYRMGNLYLPQDLPPGKFQILEARAATEALKE